MAANDQLPEDPHARAAFLTILEMMAEPGTSKDLKHKTARTILEWTLPKPAQKSDVTLRSAEDFLDELVAKEGDDG